MGESSFIFRNNENLSWGSGTRQKQGSMRP